MYYVESCTTGRKLPAKIIKISFIRQFFLMPYILVDYEGTNLKGDCTYRRWFRKYDVGGFVDNS